jgi:Glycosyltransferase family 87
MKAAAEARAIGRMPVWAKAGLLVVAAALFLGVLALLPLPIPPYLDFQVLYQTNMGLLRGIPVYDHAGQVQMIAQLAGVAPDQVYILPFPYPPWYALSTVWLAWIPIQVAARIWFGIGLMLMLASVWLLTDHWRPAVRNAAFVAAILFPPVIGSLFVGQYGFPLLLGAAMMIVGLQKEDLGLTTIAAMLLTVKPHLGGLLLLAAAFHLWQRGDAFGRRAIVSMLIAGLVLFCAGFLADRLWPVDYVHSLMGFQKDSGVSSCGLCSSLPALIASLVAPKAGLALIVALGAILFVVLIAMWLPRWAAISHDQFQAVAATSVIVLLASPYLLNYDFVLLLVPLAFLAKTQRSAVRRILLILAIALPWAALGIWGRQGNFVYPLCALLVMAMLYWPPRPLDVSNPAS